MVEPVSPLTVVHLGDSITVGQYVDTRHRWAFLIEERLQAAYGGAVAVLNAGVSGEQTRMALERFPTAVQSVRPDVLTIQYGMNDCNCWQTDNGAPRVSERAFVANIVEMVERARLHGVLEVVLMNNHPTTRWGPMVNGEPYEQANTRYSDAVAVAARDAGVELVDVRAAFTAYPQEQLADLLLPAPDQLHLSVAGNAVYADAVWPAISAALERAAARLEGSVSTR